MSDPLQERRAADQLTLVEKRVEVAAAIIQKQFEGVTRLIDQRIDSNKEQSNTRIDAAEKMSIVRHDHIRAMCREGDEAVQATAERRALELHHLLLARIEAIEKARDIQAAEYERRLSGLNHEHDRIDAMAQTYVRGDLYAKDMERLYSERRDQLAQAEAARHSNMTTMVMAAVSILGVVITIALHFIKGVGP
jgi:hypothetical protein